MTTIFIIILILSQLICFYFIIILNLKISKFKDLEVRQDKLIREMDDAIAAYLLEIREENERFIKELQSIKENKATHTIQQSVPEIDLQDIKIEPKKIVPKNIAVSAYSKQASNNIDQAETEKQEETTEEKTAEKKEPETFEEKVIQLYKDGKTIEEIAKITEKGKTEIELLLKFHT